MQLRRFILRLIVSVVLLLSTFLCPLSVIAQKNPKQVIQITKSLVKSKKTRLQPVQRQPHNKPVSKVPTSGVSIMRNQAPASAAKLLKTSVPSIVKPLTSKDLMPNVNTNTFPQRHLNHYTAPNCPISTNINNDWWIEYIGNIIEDQMIQQGKEKIEQLFDNKKDSQPNEMEKLYQLIPIKHDIRQERDRNTSYIYYCAYGYELAA